MRDDRDQGNELDVVATSSGGAVTTAPSDDTTLTAVLVELDDEGFTCSFVVRPDARVEWTACREHSSAADLVPPGCGDSRVPPIPTMHCSSSQRSARSGATSVLGFGPSASDDDALVVAGLDLERP